MSTMRSQDEIRNTVVSLGLPEHPYFMRRAARAMDLLDTGKVNFVGDDIFRVHSQFDDKHYHVELNHGNPGCTCPDHQKNPGVLCKHMIGATLYKKERQATQMIIRRRNDGLWCIIDGNHLVQITTINGKLFCNCSICRHSRQQADCDYKKAVLDMVKADLKALNADSDALSSMSNKPVNECGSNEAKALQDKMNGQLTKSGNNGNGAKQAPSQPQQLDLSDPFQESESYDIDQIEGRKNGELAWKLSNGKYCISYAGVMKLAEKHGVEFFTGSNSQTAQVIARARLNSNERVSGKLPIPSQETAIELAKRNAARQLLPLAEIKATEHKAKLEAEFNWQKAYAKCVELVGTEANVDIIIYELVRDGKLRQDSPTHYDRTEWLIIHNACKKDAESVVMVGDKPTSTDYDDNNDGGDKTPSSPVVMVGDKPTSQDDGKWREWYNKCVKVSSLYDTGIVINQMTPKHYYRKDRITDDEWQRIFSECQRRREEYERTQAAKADFASAQQAYKFKHIRDISGYDVKSKQFVGRPPLNSKEFLAKCQEAIEKVRAEDVGLSPTITTNPVEANEQPLENSNGKRKLQMDKKLRTWLIESDGTKKKISCREICEQFNDGSLVTRLRECIDDGADLGIIELDD